jgi:hypothetical protein
MRIDSSGNVGIGTSSPSSKLDVNGAITGRAVGAEGGQIQLNNPTNLSTGLIVDVVTADVGRIYSSSSNFVLQLGQLGSTGGIVSLYTAAIERMRIDASGNVGIGTTSPGSKLEVNQGILTINASDQALARLQLKNTGTSGRTWDLVGGLPGTDNVNFSIYDNTAAATRLTIGSSGQLGIGGANYGTSGQVLTSNGSAAAPSWQSVSATGRLLNVQVFTSSGTYTRGSGVTTAVVFAVGGGGGGKGANGGSAGGNGGNGGTTSFGAHVTAAGGTGSTGSQGGAGGTGGTSATLAIPGQGGGTGLGADSAYFGGIGGGQGGGRSSALGTAGTAGSRGGGGSGGSGETACGPQFGGGGGGQGETGIKYTTTVGATETVTIGAGGTAGTGSAAGGAGGPGYIIVYEYS